jgi:hypothetical protein
MSEVIWDKWKKGKILRLNDDNKYETQNNLFEEWWISRYKLWSKVREMIEVI